jgi:Tfp pilus assembly protein PilO
MSETTSRPDYLRILLNHLRHPLKLRLILCVAIVGGWYLLFFAPLSEQMASTAAKVQTERQRITAAREIERQKKALAPSQGRVLANSDVNALINQVIDHLRSSPLKLVDLKPEKSKNLGPYEALSLQLTLVGRFADIDEFLRWVQASPTLLRIGSIKLNPLNKDPTRLTAQVGLQALAEIPSATKAKPSTGPPARASRPKA